MNNLDIDIFGKNKAFWRWIRELTDLLDFKIQDEPMYIKWMGNDV